MQNFYKKIQTLPRINELSTSNELNDIFLSSLIELDDTDFFNKNSLYIIYPNDSENITLYGKKETQININEIEPYINKLLMNGHLFTGSLLTLIIFIVFCIFSFKICNLLNKSLFSISSSKFKYFILYL